MKIEDLEDMTMKEINDLVMQKGKKIAMKQLDDIDDKKTQALAEHLGDCLKEWCLENKPSHAEAVYAVEKLRDAMHDWFCMVSSIQGLKEELGIKCSCGNCKK